MGKLGELLKREAAELALDEAVRGSSWWDTLAAIRERGGSEGARWVFWEFGQCFTKVRPGYRCLVWCSMFVALSRLL